ncbi:hypothetical protein ABZ671_14420 [Micromonospora sp. NPDC006766]|uniref:hypothetical protein n=1 Tax=Micromonospora sp. NPDC006766 TaxID=3154778 RepID=UPI0033C2AC26
MIVDEVWHRLNPDAGRMTRRAARRLAVSLLAVAALAGAGLVLWHIGIVVPRLNADGRTGGFGYEISPAERSFAYQVNIRNDGKVTLVVQAVGAEGPGLELTERTILTGAPPVLPRGTLPITLHPGQEIGVRLGYRVTDCAAVSTEDWPIPVRVKGPLGVRTVGVMPETLRVPDEEPDETMWSGDRDPYGRSWQDALARQACAPPVGR